MARRSLDPCVRCGRDSDMTCSVSDPLDALLDELTSRGFEAHFNEIDARLASSAFSVCTNCGARGRFNYMGIKRDRSYRAFLSCRECSHWLEV